MKESPRTSNPRFELRNPKSECPNSALRVHDHVRIEQMLFDGAVSPIGGALEPDASRPGLGLEWKSRDAERYAT